MREALKTNTTKLKNADLKQMMENVSDNSEVYHGSSYLMIDDKAPVELLGMQVIDQIIQEEVSYYKGIYEKDGIQGLLREL